LYPLFYLTTNLFTNGKIGKYGRYASKNIKKIGYD